jgi:hypothetical protein
MGQHLNEKNKAFVAQIITTSDFGLWDVIACTIDEYYLGIPVQPQHYLENLRETFERRIIADQQHSYLLQRALWEFMWEIILPAYKDRIRKTVYGHLDHLHTQGDFFNDDVVDWEEYRLYLVSGVIEIVKIQIGLDYNWLPKRDDDDDNGDGDLDPDFDPVDEARKILDI